VLSGWVQNALPGKGSAFFYFGAFHLYAAQISQDLSMRIAESTPADQQPALHNCWNCSRPGYDIADFQPWNFE